MSTNALHQRMMAEFLDKIKDWPEEAQRALVEAIGRMMRGPSRKKPAGKKLSERFWKAYGAWDSDETAEELMRSIRDARHFRDRDIDL